MADDRGRNTDPSGNTLDTNAPVPVNGKGWSGKGFKSYLRYYKRGSPRWERLYEVIDVLNTLPMSEGGVPYQDFMAEEYMAGIRRLGPKDSANPLARDELSEPEVADLIETLIQVETEWHLDQRLRGRGPKAPVEPAQRWQSNIPEGSYLNRCRYVPPGGVKACGRGTVPGTSRCRDHGGTLIEEKTRQAVLMGAYLGLVDATDEAVGTLVDVARNGRNELARVQAAKEILDRAGLTAELNISVRIEGDERTAKIEALQNRLDTMGSALRHRVTDAIEATASDSSDQADQANQPGQPG